MYPYFILFDISYLTTLYTKDICHELFYYNQLSFYFMSQSVASRASNASSKMLEEIANRSQTKIYKVEGTFNDEQMRVIWNAFGLYISRNLRMGRGVNVPKFGIFTFTPPEVRLKGVTNEGQRDQQPRTPVFLIQKQFVKGVTLRTAIFYHQQFGLGLRPYSAIGSTGEVPVVKMNLIEVSSYANMSKDQTELGINRIVKYIQEKLINGQNISLELPNIGQLICRNKLVAVKFNEYILIDTRHVLAKSVDQRKMRGNMSLTTDNLRKFANIASMTQKLSNKSSEFFEIDDNAKKYLSSTFNLHIDDSNMKRSVTNFDRTVASRIFDRTNKSLKDSQTYRVSQSGFFPNHSTTSKEFNMALKLIREWIRDQGYNSIESYNAVCQLAGKKTQVLNFNDLWNACKQISIDITEQQGQQLFRVLDSNKDGFITAQDWKINMHFDHNNPKFIQLLEFIKQKKYTLPKILAVLGLQGIRKTTLYTLKNGLINLWPALKEQDALLLSKFITKGKQQIEVERIIDALNIKQEQKVEVDNEWQAKFFNRLKRKLHQHNITDQQLESKFRIYDKNSSGYIEQTDFKNVIGELGISLNLTQLIKLVKFVPLNQKNHLQYGYVINKLYQAEPAHREELSKSQFTKVLKESVLNKDKLPFEIPISVGKLTSWLQSKHFKNFPQSEVLKYVRLIDLNEDDEVGEEDIRRYRESVKDKTFKKLSSLQIQQLLIRLRQKSIKKKISFYDVFRKVDKVNSGFITYESWMKYVNEIISFTQDQKINLFNYMDKNNTHVIDYKTFLAYMNGSNSVQQSENFNWVQQAVGKIKAWFNNSKLTVEDAFKVVDRDGDTYINEKDIHTFLLEKLKYKERELSSVRLQKLIKFMDSYKHGRITLIDWHKLINQNKDWLSDVKQQIGIVLSKHYSSLSEAFTTITNGEKKLLFNAFQQWVRNNHVLSGFMVNQEMLKSIFVSLDQHKKGYLLEKDFIALFGSYDWKAEHCKEFMDFLSHKFSSADDAFRFMAGFTNKSIDFSRFRQVVSQFFGNRFQQSDIANIWKTVAGGKQKIEMTQFKKLHDHIWSNNQGAIQNQYPKDSWRYQDFSIIKGTTVRSSEFQYQQREKMEQQCQKFINNLKDLIASSPKTLQQAFQEVDPQKIGKVSNLLFKKAFRLLNIALTSKQIDLLLNYCEYQSQNLIDWKQFIKQVDLQQDKQKIKARLQPKLQHISDLLHYYMISPKDAFRKWNNPRSGYMNFEQFYKMIKQLYSQASQSLPEYQQLEDIFQFIDIRKDGQLDFQEFTQVFRGCNPPNLLMGTTPAPADKIISKKEVDKQESVPTREKTIPLFRHSPIYEQFVKVIGRNRKYIQQQIEKENNQNIAFIPFSDVQKVIRAICQKQGVKVDASMVRNLIAFAMTGEKVDYHLLVAKFKDMSVEIDEFPKQKVF